MKKLTKKRQLILEVIKQSDTPVCVDEIRDKIKQAKINFSTIYRGVDYLLDNKLISKTNINNATYYYLKTEPHRHFIVCLNCHKFKEIGCNIYVEDFQIVEHDLIAYGYCKECRTDL